MKTQLKKEFKDKLIKLGVYKQWKKNLIDYCEGQGANVARHIEDLNGECYFRQMIWCSFHFAETPEGHDFWRQVSES